MAKTTDTAITDETLLAEVQAEIDAMSSDDLSGAAGQALFQQEVRKARNSRKQMSEEQKERQKIYNRKRNMKLKLLAEKAVELGIKVTDKQIQNALNVS